MRPISSKLKFFTRHPILLAFAAYFVITAVMTWPLIVKLPESILAPSGDSYYYTWQIGWFLKVIREGISHPFFTELLNYPEGWPLASTEIPMSMVALAMPAALVAGPIAGYNSAVFISFVLSGTFAFMWVRQLSGSSWAGFVAGTIYAFSPYRWSHYLAGHMNLLGTQWFPLYFMGLSEVLSGKRKLVQGPLICGLGLGLIGLTSMYYLYMSLLVSLAYAAGYLAVNRSLRTKIGSIAVSVGKSLMVAIPLMAVTLIPFMALAVQGALPSRGLETSRFYSASPTDYVLPSTAHALWGHWMSDHFDRSYWIEATLYLGITTIALATFALSRWKRTKHWRRTLLALGAASALAFILSLGVEFFWLSNPVEIPASIKEALDIQWWSHVPMPGRVLYKVLPFYSVMRVWMRFGIFVILFSAILAGLGIALLLGRRSAARRTAIGIALSVLILFEFWPHRIPDLAFVPREVDQYLAAHPAEGAFVQFPSEELENQALFFSTMVSGRSFMGADFAANQTPQYRRVRPSLAGFPDQESVGTLEELGIRFVVLDSRAYENIDSVIVEAITLGLKPVGLFEDQYLLELPLD